MSNRRTGLDASVFTVMGNTLIGDLKDATIEVENRTSEGRGIADINDWPVLVNRGCRITGTLMVLASASTIPLMGTALSLTPAGTVTFTTGAGSYSGTAVLTAVTHRVSRGEIQEYDVTLNVRGALGYS